MIQYNPKDWFTFIFRFHKADTFRSLLPMLIGMSIYTALVVWIEIRFDFIGNSHLKNFNQMHTLLGFAISMLLVFRTNTAYERWWEARKLWGNLVNASRNLAIKLNVYLALSETEIRNSIAVNIGAFAHALHLRLRNENITAELAEKISMDINGNTVHIPSIIAGQLIGNLNNAYMSGLLSNEQFLSCNTETVVFMDVGGACERIKNTPIPFSYSVFIKKIVFFYTMTLPFGFAFSLGYVSIPVTVFIFYVLASLEIIAEEIEDPFSGDENDLPTKRLAENIDLQCSEILYPENGNLKPVAKS